MASWTSTQGQQSEIQIENRTTTFRCQVFQHTFAHEGRPIPLDWSYWLNSGRRDGLVLFGRLAEIWGNFVHSNCITQAQRFVTGALQLYPDHTENLLRSFWMRSWGIKSGCFSQNININCQLHQPTIKMDYFSSQARTKMFIRQRTW